MNTELLLSDGLFKVILVGRTNVGKSSLFNLISKKRITIAHETPGATRDCIQRVIFLQNRRVTIIDSGGFEALDNKSLLQEKIRQNVSSFMANKADLILFVVNAKEGITPGDYEIAKQLRCLEKPVLLVVNKADHTEKNWQAADFYSLGFPILYTSASQSIGLQDLEDTIATYLPGMGDASASHLTMMQDISIPDQHQVRIAVLGKPNVGKSSFINAIHCEDRLLTSEVAGTTMDAVDTALDYKGKRLLLIDTAGIRRQRSIEETLEKMAVARSFCAIDRAQVVILMLDATLGITEQDKKIAGLILEKKRACVFAINKWDARHGQFADIESFTDKLRHELPFLAFAPVLFISAKTGLRVFDVIDQAIALKAQYCREFPTSLVNRHVQNAQAQHPPPVTNGTQIKFFFAAQLQTAPPTFVVSCNRPRAVHVSYTRYLKNHLREALGIQQIPIHLFFRRKGDLKLNTPDSAS